MKTPEQTSRYLSEVVAAAIKAAGLSQRAVAEQSGIPLVTLNRKLRHLSAFTVVELAAIAAALNLSLTELALRTEQRAMAAA